MRARTRAATLPRAAVSRAAQAWPTAGGAVVAALGALVVVAWHARVAAVIQLRPDLAPMQYNTALGLLVCGASLIALRLGAARAAGIGGAVAAALGALTLVEYACDANLGIDEAFLRVYITTATSSPGRMAPTTALCFLLTGLGLAASSARARGWAVPPYGCGLGALTATLAATTLLGYALGEARPFGALGGTAMAPHTAAAFALLGSALFADAHRTAERRYQAVCSVVPIACAGVLLSLALWSAIGERAREAAGQLTRREAEDLAHDAAATARVQTQALARMARRLEIRGASTRAEWQADARRYLADFPEMLGLAHLGADGTPLDLVMAEGAAAARPALATPTPRREDALAAARGSGSPTWSAEIPLGEERGLLLAAPLFRGERTDGFIAALFSKTALFAPIAGEREERGFAVEAIHVDRPPTAEELAGAGPDAWAIDTATGFAWRFRVSMGPELAAASETWNDELALAFGLALTCAISLVALLLRFARERAELAERRGAQVALLNAAAVALGECDSVEQIEEIASDFARLAVGATQAHARLGAKPAPDEAPAPGRARIVPVIGPGGEWHGELEVRHVEEELSEHDGELLKQLARLAGATLGALLQEQELETQVRQRTRDFHLIASSAREAIWIGAIDGSSLVYASPACERVFGRSAAALLARAALLRECIHPDDAAAFDALFAEVASGSAERELRVIRAGDDLRWVRVRLTRADAPDSAVPLLVGTADDVTERTQLGRQLLQAQKLEAIGQLAAGVAHEINTPAQYVGDNVRFLKGAFADLVRFAKERPAGADAKPDAETDVDFLVEEIPAAIDQTLEGIGRISTIVSAMKEFSHPGVSTPTPVDLNRAIQSTLTVARNEWKYVADLETHFDPGLPPVPVIPGEFNQVVLNLVVNAAHAIAGKLGKDSGQKGKIAVHTRRDGEIAEVRVQDSGTGIPEAVRDRVFEPFFTTKEVGRGTGQGLAIARSVVVEKHGGELFFETELGVGTTFVIRLPLEHPALRAQ